MIASHGNPFAAVAGTPYLAEGEAAVIRPLGAQGFAIVARIAKDGWSALEAPSSTKSSRDSAPSSHQPAIAVTSCRATTASA